MDEYEEDGYGDIDPTMAWFWDEELDEETETVLAEAVQQESVAMLAWDRAKGKKGKRKEEGKITKGKGRSGRNLSLARKKKTVDGVEK